MQVSLVTQLAESQMGGLASNDVKVLIVDNGEQSLLETIGVERGKHHMAL